MHYSLQPRLAKGYGFLSFTKNMGKNIGKNIRKNLSGKYSQRIIKYAERFPTDTLKISWKRLIQKSAEATTDLIANKIVDAVAKSYDCEITEASKNSQQNNTETVAKENYKEKHEERYVSPEKRHYWWTEIKIL